MTAASEFHYRLRTAVGGYRPGTHPGSTTGAGQAFAAHARLFDSPDPRRIDIRASLRNVRQEWLVRHFKQRSAISVYAVVDVSRSMRFGTVRSKLSVAADFAESLGLSAFRAGDSAGLLAFDDQARTDLYLGPRYSRGRGIEMAATLRGCTGGKRTVDARAATAALRVTLEQLTGKRALIFLVSDFHWPLDALGQALDMVSQSSVVPVVVWDPAESSPPAHNGLLAVADAETGARRAVWLGAATRHTWRRAVEDRRSQLTAQFAGRDIRPYFMQSRFDPETLSQYFLEEFA